MVTKEIENRLERLEKLHIGEDLPDISVTMVSSKDQAENPEKYRRVLMSEQAGYLGKMFRHYKLKTL